MVLTHSTNHTYAHPFPTVTLAFFLRYYSPRINPFSAHVLSTDTLSSFVDPDTGRLHTTRIHVKKSRMPSAVIKLLPTSMTGGAGDKSAYVLETSVVDINEGWMATESRNMNFTGILSVVEKHNYSVAPSSDSSASATTSSSRALSPYTNVTTSFSYSSTIGNRKQERAAMASDAASDNTGSSRLGSWISGWSASRIQRSIESMASNRTDDQQTKSREGMRMVLERLRSNGVVAVLRELGRMDGSSAFDQERAMSR